VPITHYAIDGYNVMLAGLAESPAAEDLEDLREDLLSRCRRLKESVTVFFDASKAPPGLGDDVEGRGKLTVVYVRSGSADDAIVTWLRGQTRPDEIAVITNDRELAARAKTHHSKAESVEAFLKKIDPERMEGAEKPKISSSEARKWAEEFGVDPDAKV